VVLTLVGAPAFLLLRKLPLQGEAGDSVEGLALLLLVATAAVAVAVAVAVGVAVAVAVGTKGVYPRTTSLVPVRRLLLHPLLSMEQKELMTLLIQII
jgi:hypothetical protein